MSLTRADLESSRLHRLIAQTGLKLPVLNEAELQASIQNTLKHCDPNADIWIFAYGSLIWNPVFHFVDRRVGTIYGWHRRFCLWTPLGRGAPDNPGLVLGLDRGGSCRGVAYRISAAKVGAELSLIWRREMVVDSYVPRWVKMIAGEQRLNAIAFTINPQHPLYAGRISPETTVKSLATAHGQLGSAADYLSQTVDGLSAVGIQDRHLIALRDKVIEYQA